MGKVGEYSLKLTTMDIVMTVAIAFALGIIYMANAVLWGIIESIGGPITPNIVHPLWYLAGLIPAFIIRKPGIFFLGEFLGCFAELLAGSPAGPTVLLFGIAQGIAPEIVLAVTFYKKWNYPVMGIAMSAAAIISFIMDYFMFALYLAGTMAVTGMFILRVVAAWIWAAIGIGIAKGVAKTGALSGYPIAKEV
jgi:energy-coupling factor transport system substrate-specific component